MTVFTDGRIFDGERFITGNVVTDGDRIVSVGTTEIPSGSEIVDCTGKTVCPGFVDSHSHNDFFLNSENSQKYFAPFLRQGITTAVVGNCGFSVYGYKKGENEKYIGGGLFKNNSAGKDFSDLAGFIENVKNVPYNVVPLIGHGTLRLTVNGEGSNALTERQMEEMEQLTEKLMSQGAAGLSLGLMYEPSQFAPKEEIERLARVVARHGGILTAHARAYSKVSTAYDPPVGGRAHNLRAAEELCRIKAETGVDTHYSHFISVGKKSWPTAEETLRLLSENDISYDIYSVDNGISIITVIIPVWYLALTKEQKKKFITRTKLYFLLNFSLKFLGFGFKDIMLADSCGKYPELEGKRVTEIAKIWKKSPYKTYVKLVGDTDAKGRVNMYNYMNDDILKKLLVDENSMFMTDAWIEETGVQYGSAYYCYPRFLTFPEKFGLSEETILRRMTSAACDRFKIEGRGRLKAGNYADITVYDPKKISYDEQNPENVSGIEHVMINGKSVIVGGELKYQPRAGKVLTRV